MDRAGPGSGPEMVTSFLPEKRICLTTVLLQRFGISASHGKLFEITQRQRILVGLWARPPALSPARSSPLHTCSSSLPLEALRIFTGRGAMQVGCRGRSQIPSTSRNLRPIRGRIIFPATTNSASTQQHGAARAAAPPNGTSQAADDAAGEPTLGCNTQAGKKKRHAKKKKKKQPSGIAGDQPKEGCAVANRDASSSECHQALRTPTESRQQSPLPPVRRSAPVAS